jgi:hypothetical protein
MYFVICRLFLPPPATHGSMFGSGLGPTCHLSILISIVSPVRVANPYDVRGFLGPKKKTIVDLLVFNSFWSARFHIIQKAPRFSSQRLLAPGMDIHFFKEFKIQSVFFVCALMVLSFFE